MEMSELDENQKKIADELDKIEIEQLHKATLTFSNNSQETKKMCVTALTATYALLATIYKENFGTFVVSIGVLGFLVSLLFYAVDVVLYYYQARLRENMQKRIDGIKLRHGILPVDVEVIQEADQRKIRLRRSFFNGSQLIYLGLMIVSVISPLLIGMLVK